MKNPIGDLPLYLSIFKKYLGRKIYLIILLTIFASLVESFGIVMLLPIFQQINNSTETVSEIQEPGLEQYVYQLMMDLLGFLGMEGSISNILILIAIMFIIKGFITFIALGYSSILRSELLKKLKRELFDKYSFMSYEYFSSRDTGFFTSLINEQVARAVMSFYHLVLFSTLFVTLIIYLVVAIMINWQFGMLVVLAGLMLILIFKKLNNIVRTLSRVTATEEVILTKNIIQVLHGFKYLISTGQISNLKKTIYTSIDKLTKYQKKQFVAGSFTKSVREPIAVVLILSVIYVQLVYLSGDLAPILVSVVLFYRSIMLLVGMQGNVQAMLELIGSMELIDNELTSLEINKEVVGKIDIKSKFNSMKFSNVSFSYNKTDKTINKLNLEILPNKMIAIVGESGAGKTTMADMITLILKPTDGKIEINSTSSHKISYDKWRQRIGYVSQETVILDGSILYNIDLNFSNNGLELENPREKVYEAARKANIHDFIESLPDGYSTQVGEKGLRLSGGQRQRLFIARELFREPDILILDEATSALDSKSESKIQDSIFNLKGRVSIVVIAHRLSTVYKADMIYVMDKGSIVESGNYEDLMSLNSSIFYNMVKMHNLEP